MKDIVTIRPEAVTETKQKLPNFIGVSGVTAGSKGISMNVVVIPPGAKSEPHFHRDFETAIYLIKGTVKTQYGPGLSKTVINKAGDFIFIPAGVPHEALNLSSTEEALAVVARNDPNEQENVQAYDPGYDN